jgi:copper resistance protein C
MKGGFSIITAAALLFCASGTAFAHAQLHNATPAVGGSVAAAPSEISLNFSEALEPSFSTVVVRDAVGKRVDKADAHLDAGDRTTMRVSLPALTEGTYIVVWRALTADTHRTEGAFIFRVGQ